MFGNKTLVDMIDRSAENPADRRTFQRPAGIAGRGPVGAGLNGATTIGAAEAAPSDGAVLNFALQLEYLEGAYYAYAVSGSGVDGALLTGMGTQGAVVIHQARDAVAAELAALFLAHGHMLRPARLGRCPRDTSSTASPTR